MRKFTGDTLVLATHNKGKVVVPTLKNRYAPTNKDNADGTLDARKSDGKRHPRTR